MSANKTEAPEPTTTETSSASAPPQAPKEPLHLGLVLIGLTALCVFGISVIVAIATTLSGEHDVARFATLTGAVCFLVLALLIILHRRAYSPKRG